MTTGSAASSPHGSDRVAPAQRVVATAPGKLILMGEHAAVYGRPALVAALGRRTTVTLERRSEGGGVELDLTTLGHRESLSWAEVRLYSETKRQEWQRFSQDPDSSSIDAVVGQEPAHVVRVALGETLAELGIQPPGIRVEVGSEIPVGAGFGSSASVAVAVIGALLVLLGAPLDAARISRVALEVERRQHGKPSGVDHSAVLNGGLLRLERTEEGLAAVPLEAASRRLEDLLVFHSGSPPDSTGTVVAGVGSRRERDPRGFDTLLDRMGDATRAFEAGLRDPDSAAALHAAVRAFEGCLEELGVVPDAVAAAIRRLEAAGGAAKISGAGTLSQDGAGALLVCSPPAGVEDLLAGYQRFDEPGRPMIGAPGLSIEDRT